MNGHLLEIQDLKKRYPLHGGGFFGPKRNMYAVDGLSLFIDEGRHTDWSENLAVGSLRPAG